MNPYFACRLRKAMVSLWGSKGGRDDRDEREHEQQNGEGHERSRSNERHEDANERTRLISPPRGGYLDPDDPAVSSLLCRLH